MLCMQRKESSYTFLEKYAYAVPIRVSLSQVHMYQRRSQLLCLPMRATNMITLSGSHRKHLYSTITFWKEKKMKSIQAGKVGGGRSKRPYLVLPLSHVYNYNLSLFILKKESVCMLLPLIHTRLLDEIIQSKAKSNQGCAFRKKSDSGLYFPHISHCRPNVYL